jgi:tetratricopeptide (TPR) repeat protein
MSEQLVRDLQKAIASSPRKPLIICGAGVSVSATDGEAPTWAALIESGITRVVGLDEDEEDWASYSRSRLKKNKVSDWIKVADEVTERLGGCGNAEFGDWIETSVGHLKTSSCRLLEAIKWLGCPVATTNYDDILASDLGVPPITWDDPEQVHRLLLGSLSGVLHLHGHWRKPKTVILGSSSYEALNADRKKTVLSEFAALDRSLVYVGCSADGLSDPDFTHLAAFMTDWQETAPRSYWLVRSDQRADAKEMLGVDNPRLFPIAFGADYTELPPFLKKLGASSVPSESTVAQFTSIEQQEPRPEIFGREGELRELEEALVKGRNAVIGGGPGFGKTALAVAALYRDRVVQRYAERRVFVSLEAEREPRALLAALAGALGLPSGGDEASLLRQIQLTATEAPLVAVLDNAEHVLEASRSDSERVLRLAGQIKNLSIVVTTRGLVPLLPDAVSIHDLTKLDAEAARQAFLSVAGSHFAVDSDLDMLLVALDGHALSIELVAARAAGGTNLAGIREAWEEQRAAVLKRVGEIESRLTSVRASLALSLQAKLLLQSPLARRLLALLAVLPAGLPQSAIPRVLADRGGLSRAKAIEIALVLQQLKLVERRFDNRLRMLTPLREAARLDVRSMAADRRRLQEFYCKIAIEGAKVGTFQWDTEELVVEQEAGNFDSVIRMSLVETRDREDVYFAINGTSQYYRFSGQGSVELLEHAIQVYGRTNDLRRLVSVHAMTADVYLTRDDIDKAKAHFTAGLHLATAARLALTQGNCYSGLGRIEELIGSGSLAEKYFRSALEKYREINDRLGEANTLSYLATIRLGAGDSEAEILFEQAHELYERCGDAMGIITSSRDLAEYRRTDLVPTLRQAIQSYHQLGTPGVEATARNRLAFLLQSTGSYQEAIIELDESSRLARSVADVSLEAVSMIIRGVTLRRIADATWETAIADGFTLLRTTLRRDDRTRAGYEELERYLTATDEGSREAARKRTHCAWERAGKLDYCRDWLELSIM